MAIQGSRKLNILFISIVVFILAGCSYFIVIPFFPGISFFDISNYYLLYYLKEYYSTISPVVTLTISSIGVLFGFYYYHNKNFIEDNRNRCARLNKFFDVALMKIDSVGILVNDVLNIVYKTKEGVKPFVSHIYHDCDAIETLLEIASCSYGWSPTEYHNILAYRAFAVKKVCEPFDRPGDVFFPVERLVQLKEEHRMLLDAARRSCYLKIEDIYNNNS